VGFVTGFLYAVQEVLEAEVRAIYGRDYIVTLVVHGGETTRLHRLAMHHATPRN
jgi:hypothetical protein